jgi:hypothetical protein
MKDVLYRAREEAEKALGEMVNKGFNNASDLCCAKDAVKILTNVATIEAMERAQWTEEESRRMQRSMTVGVPYGSSYTDPYWEQESMRRGRNSLGQFTSRMSYDDGYSGHSVNDMMVQSLERTITPDMSEVEKQRIYEQIRMIRERKD